MTTGRDQKRICIEVVMTFGIGRDQKRKRALLIIISHNK
jgi:hypothetical protein